MTRSDMLPAGVALPSIGGATAPSAASADPRALHLRPERSPNGLRARELCETRHFHAAARVETGGAAAAERSVRNLVRHGLPLG